MTTTKGNILIVDDDPYIILSLQTLLESSGGAYGVWILGSSPTITGIVNLVFI